MSKHEWLVTIASLQRKGPVMCSFIMSHHTLTFGVSWCSIISWDGWLPYSAIQMECCPVRNTLRVQESLITQFSAAVPHIVSYCSWFDVLQQLQFLHMWTVEFGRCSCLLAARINLHELCRNACLMHFWSSFSALGHPGNFKFMTLQFLVFLGNS
jgi:hypothetical protein